MQAVNDLIRKYIKYSICSWFHINHIEFHWKTKILKINQENIEHLITFHVSYLEKNQLATHKNMSNMFIVLMKSMKDNRKEKNSISKCFVSWFVCFLLLSFELKLVKMYQFIWIFPQNTYKIVNLSLS